MRRDALLVFAAVWLIYGAGIDVRDLERNTLQPAVAEALVERGTFSLRGSRRFVAFDEARPVETRWPYNDFNRAGGEVLPAKQPGEFVLAAVVYWPLARLGLRLDEHYLAVTAAMAWLTTGLIGAWGATAIYRLVAGVWRMGRGVALFTTLAYAFATTLFPYSGTVHHDALSASLVSVALFRAEKALREPSFGAGLILGVVLGSALFVSLLPIVVVAGLVFHIAAGRDVRLATGAAAGMALALSPLFAFNHHYYGGVLTGAYSGWDTARPRLDAAAVARSLDFYVGAGYMSWLKYTPIAAVGFVGATFFGAGLGRLRFLVPAACLGHLLFLTTLGTTGHCQYGPRYLMAALPLAVLGLAPLLSLSRRHPWAACLCAAIALYSLWVNLIGAIGGASYCYLSRFAPLEYLKSPSFGAGWAALDLVVLGAVALGLMLFWPASSFLLSGSDAERRAGALAVLAVGILLLVGSRWAARQEPAGRTWVTAPPAGVLVSCPCS